MCTSAADFLADTVEASRQWHDILEMWKENNCQPRVLCPTETFKYEGE